MTIYADASFAVGPTKQSVSGHVIFLNGTPLLLWGSLKQTVVVDSSCSAEYVAASVACKQAIHAENLIGFFGFSCAKPYTMYTDSTACLNIASICERLGNVDSLQFGPLLCDNWRDQDDVLYHRRNGRGFTDQNCCWRSG